MERVKDIAIYVLSKRHISRTHDAVMFDIDDTLWKPSSNESIPEMLDLLHKCRMIGYNIVIITARPNFKNNVNWTLDQIHGMGIVPDDIFFTPPELKTRLKQGLHYNFVLSVGDQDTDLGGSEFWIKIGSDYIQTNLALPPITATRI